MILITVPTVLLRSIRIVSQIYYRYSSSTSIRIPGQKYYRGMHFCSTSTGTWQYQQKKSTDTTIPVQVVYTHAIDTLYSQYPGSTIRKVLVHVPVLAYMHSDPDLEYTTHRANTVFDQRQQIVHVPGYSTSQYVPQYRTTGIIRYPEPYVLVLQPIALFTST